MIAKSTDCVKIILYFDIVLEVARKNGLRMALTEDYHNEVQNLRYMKRHAIISLDKPEKYVDSRGCI